MALTENNNQLAAPGLRDFAAQGAVFDGLMQTLRTGDYVHAYLICGMHGIGKRTLARLMAQYILCRGEKVRSLVAAAPNVFASGMERIPMWCIFGLKRTAKILR